MTHDHIRRVQDQSLRLARALGVDGRGELQAIKAASLLHDVGKLAIPEHILNKPGRLTPAEFEIMKRHAPIGADILSVIGFPYPVVPIVRHHHENWDGTGYPDGLAGEQIPIGARILPVVDCFDALTSDRPYRPRMEDSRRAEDSDDRRGKMYDRASSTRSSRSILLRAPSPGRPPPDPVLRCRRPPCSRRRRQRGGHDMAGQEHLDLFCALGGALEKHGFVVIHRQDAVGSPRAAHAGEGRLSSSVIPSRSMRCFRAIRAERSA